MDQITKIASDAIVFKTINNELHVLLIKRKKQTFHGCYAFPGGHLDYNEDPLDCCIRELKEETGISEISKPILFTVRGQKGRDPRGHYVSIVYEVESLGNEEAIGMDDALSAEFISVSTILKCGREQFSFDHYDILWDWFKSKKLI